MTTSGTTFFNPAGGDLLIYAFGLCGIRRTAMTAEHMADGRMAFNLLLSSWGNKIPNLWTVDLQAFDLIPGQATYDLPADTVMILDAYIRTASGTPSQNDRVIWPLSRTEYSAMPNKTLQAPPTVFWFDRLLAPTITFWQTPDDAQTYSFQYYRAVVIQDQDLSNGQNVDIPRWWHLALAFGLAELLSMTYAPERTQGLAAKALDELTKAREQDTENVPMYVMPAVRQYYPR